MVTKTVSINARFLGRATTGVERVAWQLINMLATRHLDASGSFTSGTTTYRFRLVAPASVSVQSPWPNLPLHKQGLLSGHAWEQIELPFIVRNDLLLSLCNTGPLFKTRQLVFLHDAQPFAIPENFSRSFRNWYRLMYPALANNAAGVLVNSSFTLAELNRYAGLKTAKTRLCYLGHEHVHSAATTEDPLARFELPKEPFVLAVSSANRNKNFHGVVKALELLGDSAPPCVIVGKMNQSHFGGNTLKSDKVTHLSYVSDQELYALYRRALCLVFPSFYEGFGLPPLEAMSLGCPVIVSNTSSLVEIGRDAALFCNPQDPKTIADQITRLRESPQLRAEHIAKGLARAKDFSWARGAEILLESLVAIEQGD